MPDDESTPQQDNAEQRSEDDSGETAGGDGQKSEALESAEKAKEEEEEAKERMKEIEEDPPEKLEDWPDDKTKYETFGGAEGNESYEESVTSKLGPSSLRHREDGSVEIEGEEVDDPEEYKGDPIPGGPTDPKASDSRAYGEPDLTDETSQDVEGKDDEDTSDDTSDDSSDDEGEGGGDKGGGEQ